MSVASMSWAGWTRGSMERASPDPLATVAAGIIAHMNTDHADAMILLARNYAGIEATGAAMTAVDRLDFHLRLRTADGMKGTRINYTSAVRTSEGARKVLAEMVRRARQWFADCCPVYGYLSCLC